jgi:PAS domain S-box-containing protein
MTSFFDIRTLALIGSLIGGLVSLSLFLISRGQKAYPGFRTWAFAALSMFVGLALIGMRDDLPDILSIILGNTGVLGYYALIYDGLAVFVERKPRRWHFLITGGIIIGPISFFTYIVPDTLARIVIFSIVTAGYSAAILFLLLRRVHPRYGKNWVFSIGIILMGGWSIVRGIYTVLFQPSLQDLMAGGILQALVFVIDILGGIAVALGMVTLNFQRAAKSLEETEEHFRSVVTNAPFGIIHSTADGKILEANPAFAKIMGYDTPNELMDAVNAKSMAEVIYENPETRPLLVEEVRRFKGWKRSTLRYRNRSGEILTVVSTLRTLPHSRGSVDELESFVEDVTDRERAEEEQKRLQEQLTQARKMEAVGRLAGGVAHDFNNLLAAISGYAEIASEQTEEVSALRNNLEEIKRAARRAGTLTARLLAFGGMQILQPRRVDLGELAAGMEETLADVLGEGIALCIRRGESLWEVNADPNRISQVLLDLAANARGLMPDGGELRIETANVRLGEADAREQVEIKNGEYVLLSLSDTGRGMDESTRDRIFEPFSGSGLGLAGAYGIVKQSGGHIYCESEVGKGTTFRIYLPRAEGG